MPVVIKALIKNQQPVFVTRIQSLNQDMGPFTGVRVLLLTLVKTKSKKLAEAGLDQKTIIYGTKGNILFCKS